MRVMSKPLGPLPQPLNPSSLPDPTCAGRWGAVHLHSDGACVRCVFHTPTSHCPSLPLLFEVTSGSPYRFAQRTSRRSHAPTPLTNQPQACAQRTALPFSPAQ